ncbi:MAG: hypothetical protein J5I93_10020 [Pirellulaceae bacterium]|nr:hypothetical protein [Pirellulaceae bacterium]
MGDLKSPTWICLKGFLFLVLGLFASGLLLLHAPQLRVALLLAVAIWAFCRFYYFAFYVIEHYIDPTYRFSGLLALAHYLLKRGRG